MIIYRSRTKGESERRRREQPANLLLNVIKETIPTTHLSKLESADMVNLYKDLYQEYWTNSKADLVIVPEMDAAELTFTIFGYTQHVAEIASRAQNTSEKNAWSLVQAHAELKTRNK